MSIDDYVLAHSDAEPDYLTAIRREACFKLPNGRMASGHLQGRLLKMLMQMIQPRRVLEIGTYVGYSALAMAEGLSPDAIVHTFEINDELAAIARPNIENSPVSHKLRLHIGASRTMLPTLGESFDVAFLDGNKREYCEYYNDIMPCIRQKGFIFADNTLWDGHIIDPAYDHDPQTRALREFNDMVANDTRVTRVVLPIRDGLTIIMKQ